MVLVDRLVEEREDPELELELDRLLPRLLG